MGPVQGTGFTTASAGATYNDSLSESATLADSTVAANLLSALLAETVALADDVTAGATFTGINLQLRHSAMSAQIYNVQWLDLAMGGAALSDIRFVQSNISPNSTRLIRIDWCEQVKIVRMNRTNMIYMFSYCTSLQSVPLFSTANVTNMIGMFQYCVSLTSAPLAGTKFNISYTDCKLSRSALVAIFNGLADLTGSTAQTITIAGNFGAAQLTQADRDIALNKNWTITG